MNDIIKNFIVSEEDWKEGGFIAGEDTTCQVYCGCGNDIPFSVTDYEVRACPNCGKGYITEFVCYQIPAELVKYIQSDQEA